MDVEWYDISTAKDGTYYHGLNYEVYFSGRYMVLQGDAVSKSEAFTVV